MAAYAIARLRVPGQGADPVRRRWPSRCSRRSRSSARSSTSGASRPLRHVAGADHPVPDVHAAAGDLDPVGVLPRDPVGAREGGAGRRRHAVPGVPQGDRCRSPRRACSPRRSSSSSSPGTTSCSRSRSRRRTSARTVPAALAVLHGRHAVPAAERRDRRGRGGRDHSDHHHGADLPAPHRVGPHRRRGQGLKEPSMAEIELDHVTKRYPDGTEAVKDVDLDIADGEFMILVGPSGCGKSTALRMIAGLEDITEGELRIGDEVVNDQRAQGPRHRDGVPELRAVSAHDRAREHGLRAEAGQGRPRTRSTAGSRRRPRSSTSTEHLDRKPANLSGGQRQRVAMGRAIVREPEGVPDGRAAVEPRRQAARADARRGLAHPAAGSGRRPSTSRTTRPRR